LSKPHLEQAFQTFVGLLEVSRTRPVTPVGQELWNEHARAIDQALLGLATPEVALREATKRVQFQLDAIVSPLDHPTFNLGKAVFAVTAAILAGVAFFVCLRISRLRKRGQLTRMTRQELAAGLLFISPWLIGFLLFFLVPMVTSLILVFANYDVLHSPRFVGGENFQNLLGFHRTEQGRLAPNDVLFWKSLWNTLYIAILAVPITQMVSLGLALLLNTEIRGVRIYRTAFYLPVIVPTVATAILWMWLLNPQTGLLNPVFNTFLAPFGLRMPTWFDDPDWARPGVVLLLVWSCGSAMIIWLAGLKSIPNVYYEAVEMDGASSLDRFFFITLPLLTPYLFFNLVIGLIGTLQLFTEAYVLVVPPSIGPGDSLLLYVYYLFLNGFSYFRMGYACALAWLLFVIIFALTWFQFKLAPRWVHYD
ncbi:MAG: ABC transporter permease subunit, partial [bacterium]